jgi:hypothetical protein
MLAGSRIGIGVIQAGKLRRFATGQAIAVRQDFNSAESIIQREACV